MPKKVFNNETITEENIEYAIEKGIKQYSKTNRLTDVMFWRLAINLLKAKYNFNDQYNNNFKKQESEREAD